MTRPRARAGTVEWILTCGVFALLLLVVLVPGVPAEGITRAGEANPDGVEDWRQALLPGAARAVHEGMRIAEIIPARRVRWRREYVLATEKYQGQARLGPFGELVDYVAGLPFVGIEPNDPQFATKLMWNYLFGPWVSDDLAAWSFEWETGHITDGGMRVESGENRDEEQSKWLRVVGRLYTPPIHAFADNDGGIMQMEIFGPTFPAFLGLVRSGPLLTYRYLSAREDDLWYYTAWDRRVRRIPPQLRYEAFGDVVIDLNTGFGFSGPVVSYSWRYLGEREMLGVIHARRYPAEWCPGRGDFAPCDAWEKRSAYIVEGDARMPYDSYSKRIIAIDKQAWTILATDLYDKNNELWKTWINFWSYRPYEGKNSNGAEFAYLLAGSGIDFQDQKGLRWRLPGRLPLSKAVTINSGLTREDFGTGNLGQAFH